MEHEHGATRRGQRNAHSPHMAAWNTTMARNTTTTKPAAKPAAKRAAKRAAKPAPVEPVTVEPAPVESTNVRAAARAATRAAIDAAIAAGKTTVIKPYAADARGVGNKHRVYVRWCGIMCGAIDADPTDIAALAIASNACGVKPDTIRGWVSHWLRHPACRPGGRANGIPKTMRVHRCDPQFHGGDVAAARAAFDAYIASDAKRVHDATPDA